MDYQSFGAVVRLLAVASMIVTVVSNYWRHGDIDMTGRYANVRKLFARGVLIGVIVAAIARINVIAMLRNAPAFDSYLSFIAGVDIVDDVIGVVLTGFVLALLAKFWNDLFDLVYELKRLVRGKANALRADDQPRAMREPREMRDRDRDRDRDRGDMRRGRRGSRGGRGIGGPGGMGDRGDRPDRGDRGDRPDRGDRGNDRPVERPNDREIRRPDPSRETPGGGNP